MEIRKLSDPRVCSACDLRNRETVLRLAAIVRVFNERLADFLVMMSSYKGEFEEPHRNVPKRRQLVSD
jgi:hypothetical protein